jgi:hypothetical protein
MGRVFEHQSRGIRAYDYDYDEMTDDDEFLMYDSDESLDELSKHYEETFKVKYDKENEYGKQRTDLQRLLSLETSI